MFGPRLTTVFRSRWRALWWAASVLVGAYFSIPAPDDGKDADRRAEVAAAALTHQSQPAHSGKHVNPWAKDAK